MNDRRRLLMIAALGLVGLLALDRLVVAPGLRAWRAQSARLAALREDVNQGTMLADREALLRGRWAEMRDASLPLDPADAEEVVLQAIGRWARGNGVVITDLIPRWRPHPDGHQVLECRASAQGSLVSLARFLHALETDPLPIRLEQFDLAARDDRGQQLTLNARFSGLQVPAAERRGP